MRTYEEIKPAVFIYTVNPDLVFPVIKGIQEGLEEEGVPCEVKVASGDAASLAIQAARESRLGIGIGIGADRTCILQHRRLQMNTPVYCIQPDIGSRERYRLIGSHAARLVKNLPLKEEDRGARSSGSY